MHLGSSLFLERDQLANTVNPALPINSATCPSRGARSGSGQAPRTVLAPPPPPSVPGNPNPSHHPSKAVTRTLPTHPCARPIGRPPLLCNMPNPPSSFFPTRKWIAVDFEGLVPPVVAEVAHRAEDPLSNSHRLNGPRRRTFST
jgi:hypothetical protein